MMARPTYLQSDTLQQVKQTAFNARADRDLWKMAFDLSAESDISNLSSLVAPPEPATPADTFNLEPNPLPVVVSPQPGSREADDLLGPEFASWRKEPEQAQQPEAQPEQPDRYDAGVTIPGPDVSPESGTPIRSPGEMAPAVAAATGAAGVNPGPQLGTVAGGSHPEQQATAYQEARASGLDDEGAKILVAVTETEGGLGGAIGDQGQSRGGYQFHEGGQMPAFRSWLRQQGIQGDPKALVNDIRLTTRFASTTYLGRAIAAGRAQGLSGPALATYVQQHGQVSVDPWKTGQNYQRLYGGAAPDPPNASAAQPPAPAAPLTPAAASVPAPPAGASRLPSPGPDFVWASREGAAPTWWRRDWVESSGGRIRPVEDGPVASAAPAAPWANVQPGMQAEALSMKATEGGIDLPDATFPVDNAAPAGGYDEDGVRRQFDAFPPTPRGSEPFPEQVPPDQMNRQPLGQQRPELPADEYVDPDAGPREAIPGSAGAQNLTPYGPEPPPISQADVEEAGRAASQAPAPAPTEPESPFKPLYDAAGTIVGYVQGAAEGIKRAGTGLYEAAKEPQNAVDTAGAAAGAMGQAVLAEANPTPEQQLANVGKLPMQRGLEVVQAALDAGGTEVGRRVGRAAGLTDEELFSAFGIPISGDVLAGFAGSVALDPTNLIGAGPATRAGRAAVSAAPEAARGAVSRVRSALDANAERVAAADARAAQQGSTATAGTFGQSWDDASRNINRSDAPQPIDPAIEGQVREQFGRLWQEPAVQNQIDTGVRQVSESRGGRQYTEPQAEISGPVQIETDMSGRANATMGASPALGTRLAADVGSSLGSSVMGAAVGAGAPAETPEERRRNALIGAGVGLVGGPLASRAMRSGSGAQATFGFGARPASQAASAAPDPTMARMARMLSDPNVPTTPNKRGFLERWAQAMTDDRAGLRHFQEAVSQAIGRPLQAGEMVAELTRRNPASIAGQRLQEELRPALLKVGDDDDYLAQFLTHSHNVDVSREIGQQVYDAAIAAGSSPQMASRRAMMAANTRQFSGDLKLADTQAQLQAIEQRVRSLPDGDTRWQAIQDAAQGVWDMNRKTLERKRDAGIISDDLYTTLTQRYPKYVRTDIADYFDKGTGAPGGGGKRVGLSDIGIQKISPQGTTKERINPLLSTVDQTYAAESAIVRNEAGKAFEELLRLDPAWQQTFKEVVPAQGVNRGNPATTVPSSYTLRGKEQFLRVWDGGTERTFVVPGEYAALVSPQAGRILGDSTGANAWRTMMNVYKSLITSKNPAFAMLVSPARDIGDYAIREATLAGAAAKQPSRTVTRTTRAGNTITLTQSPNEIIEGLRSAGAAVGALPRILADYEAAIPDAFAGILSNTYQGDLARMMREGAGQGSRPGHDLKELRNAYADLKRTNGLEVRNAGDLLRLAGNVVTLGAEPIGGRIEQIPRLAAARRAQRRGASDVGQVMAFRDATVDFQRAGEVSRAWNEVVPFFNVAMQGGAQTVRTVRQNPAAALAATAATIGTASVAAEAWNRSDEQRARDYEDVPDYLKRTGIVLMLPGVEGRSERGDRLPNYAWIPVGQYGALVQTAKEAAMQTAKGEGGADLSTPAGWAGLLNEVGGVFSPLRGESAGAVTTSLIPPGLSTAADLSADRDLYRGSKISTDPRDENASALSQGSASLFNRVTGQESRPSQWEHLYRDLGGYGATVGLAASNMATEAVGARQPKDEERPIQNAPVVGGLVTRTIRDTGGQRMEEAREDRNRVPEAIRPILEEAGLRREEVLGVGSRYKGAQLTREEQQNWQARANRLITEYVRDARGHNDWDDRTKRQELVRQAVTKAKQEAASDVLDISSSDAQDRIEREEARKRRAS